MKRFFIIKVASEAWNSNENELLSPLLPVRFQRDLPQRIQLFSRALVTGHVQNM